MALYLAYTLYVSEAMPYRIDGKTLVLLNRLLGLVRSRVARLAPQLFDCEKSPPSVPVILMLEMLNVAVPLLDSITLLLGLAVFMA